MSAFDKILEQMPYFDGSYRRRLMAGLIVVASFLSSYLVHHPMTGGQTVTQSLTELFGFNPVTLLTQGHTLLILFIILFATGSIVEAMIDGFISRGLSITLTLFDTFVSVSKNWPCICNWLWWCITVILAICLMPLTVLTCTILNSLGCEALLKFGFRDQSDQKFLSKPAQSFYLERLTLVMQKGLDELFGDNSGVAWQRLMDHIPERHRVWVARMQNRNRDLACFIASSISGIVFSLWAIPLDHKTLLKTYGVILLLLYFFLGTAKMIRRTTVSVLELAAETQSEKSEQLASAQSLPSVE